jgi:hypothetical protein
MRTTIGRVVLAAVVAFFVGAGLLPGCGGGGKKDVRSPDEVEGGGDDDGGDDESAGGAGAGDDQGVSPEALDELNRCFVKKRPSVARCYSDAVEKGKLDKKAAGRITLDMMVSAAGKISNLSIASDTLGSADVSECVKRTIAGWSIPPPGADTTFSFSYDFEPE